MSFNPSEGVSDINKHPIMRAACDMATALRDGRTAAADAARDQLRAELLELQSERDALHGGVDHANKLAPDAPWGPFYKALIYRVRVRPIPHEDGNVYGEDSNVYSVEFEIYRESWRPYDEQDVVVEGFVRWDGCANMHTTCIHTCGPEGADALALAIKGVYWLACREIDGCERKMQDGVELPLAEEQL